MSDGPLRPVSARFRVSSRVAVRKCDGSPTSPRALCPSRYLPTNTRLQLDGVNTNWGKTTIAHVTNLVKLGLLGKTIVARNPVGNTHEVR